MLSRRQNEAMTGREPSILICRAGTSAQCLLRWRGGPARAGHHHAARAASRRPVCRARRASRAPAVAWPASQPPIAAPSEPAGSPCKNRRKSGSDGGM